MEIEVAHVSLDHVAEGGRVQVMLLVEGTCEVLATQLDGGAISYRVDEREVPVFSGESAERVLPAHLEGQQAAERIRQVAESALAETRRLAGELIRLHQDDVLDMIKVA